MKSRSTVRRSLELARDYGATGLLAPLRRGELGGVETVVLFIGHVKSGGTMLGALLDAHPDAMVGDEVDVARYVHRGFRQRQLLLLMAASSRREAAKGRVTARRLEPYAFAIPGQWQGRARDLRVLGDSRAGPTTRRLGENPRLVDRLERIMDGVDLRIVHVVRDPLDPISVMIRRGGRSPQDAIADYSAQCVRLDTLRQRFAGRMLTVRYEAFVADPLTGLDELRRFVALAPEPLWANAAAGAVQADRAPEREAVTWRDEDRHRVGAIVAEHEFLAAYTEAGRP